MVFVPFVSKQNKEENLESLLAFVPASQEEFARISRNEAVEGLDSSYDSAYLVKRQDDGFWTPGEGESSTSAAAVSRTPLVIVTVTSVVDVTPTVTATVLIPPTSTSVVTISNTVDPTTVLSTLTLGDSALPSANTPTSVPPPFIPSTTDTNAPIFGGSSGLPAKVVASSAAASMPSVVVVNGSSRAARQPIATGTILASPSGGVFGGLTSQMNLVSTGAMSIASGTLIVGPSSTAVAPSSISAISASASGSSSEQVFGPINSQINIISTPSSAAPAAPTTSALPFTPSQGALSSSAAATVSDRIFSTTPSQVAIVSTASTEATSDRIFSTTPSQVAIVSTQATAISSAQATTSDRIFSTTPSQVALVSTPATSILATVTSTLPPSVTTAPIAASASAALSSASAEAASFSDRLFSMSGAQTAVVASLSSQAASASSALAVIVASISSVSVASESSASLVSSISAAASSATKDSPAPGVVTSHITSGSATKTSSGAKGEATGAPGTTGESTATFFSQIGKSPVSIVLTVLVCLGILAVLLGIAAFFIRRCHRRRRREAAGAILLTDSPDEHWQREFKGEDPFSDDGESAMDVLPGAVWARRGGGFGAQELSPREMQSVEGSPLTTRTGFTTQRPSSDWTSIVGDHNWPETEDERSRKGSTDLLQVPGYSTRGGRRSNAPPLPPPHPLATSMVPDTPSAYSNETRSSDDSAHSESGSESDERLLRNMAAMGSISPGRAYNTFRSSPPAMPNRSRESWRMSLDRVMANAAEFVGAKALMEVDEDNYTQFAKNPRKPPPPPIVIRPATDPRDIPTNFTPLSSTYSDRFAFSPERPQDLPRFNLPPPLPTVVAPDSLYPEPPLRQTRSGSDLSYLSAYYRRDDGSSQGHGSQAGSSVGGSQSGSPQLAAESMSRWGSAESGADTVQQIESDSDRSRISDKSWRVVAPTSRNTSMMDVRDTRKFADPPLPPVAPLFSPAIPFSAQIQPPSALTRAATLESRRTYYSDEGSRQGTVRANSMKRGGSYDSGTTIGQPLPDLQQAHTGQRAQASIRSSGTFGTRESDVEGGANASESHTGTDSASPDMSNSMVKSLMLERRRKSDASLINL